MKKYLLLSVVVLSAALLFSGCQKAFLSKGIPEMFFADNNMKIDDTKNVSYTFKSNLDDPFKYRNTPVDLNPSYESVLKYYVNTKYNLVGSDGGDYHFDVILQKCTYNSVSAGRQTASVSGSTSGVAWVDLAKVTTELTVKVSAAAGGKTTEREIAAMGEFTGNASDISIISRSFDLAIRATISRIDRFLDQAFGAAEM